MSNRSTLSDFQKYLHLKEENIPLILPFLEERVKCAFYETKDLLLEFSIKDKGDSVITYDIKTWPYYELLRVYCNQPIPKIEARSGYEIRMKEFPLFSIFQNLQLVFDEDKILGEWPMEYFFTSFNFLPLDERKSVSYSIGARPELNQWSTTIQQTTLNYVFPLFFSGGTKSFPLMLCGKGNKLQFVFTLKRELKDLIEIRKITEVDALTGEKEYQNVEFDYRFISTRDDEKKIPPIQMGGTYSTHLEIEEYLKNYEARNYEFEYDRIEMKVVRENCNIGHRAELEIPPIKNPVHTVYWMARNKDGSPFNFTTSTNESEGISPLSDTSLENKIRGENIFKLPGWNTEKIQPLLFNKSIPEKRGINMWCSDLFRDEGLTPSGRVLDGTKLNFNFISVDECSSESTFEIIVIFVYTSIFKFTSVPSQEERETKLSSLEIGSRV